MLGRGKMRQQKIAQLSHIFFNSHLTYERYLTVSLASYLLSNISCLHVSCLKPYVSCLLHNVSCLLSHILSHVCCLTSPVSYLASPVLRFLSLVSCLMFSITCHVPCTVSCALHCAQLLYSTVNCFKQRTCGYHQNYTISLSVPSLLKFRFFVFVSCQFLESDRLAICRKFVKVINL